MNNKIKSSIGALAWAWTITLGGLLITPNGVFCIVCNPGLIKTLGVISILIGASAFAFSRQGVATDRL